jgi:hypothetical protein
MIARSRLSLGFQPLAGCGSAQVAASRTTGPAVDPVRLRVCCLVALFALRRTTALGPETIGRRASWRQLTPQSRLAPGEFRWLVGPKRSVPARRRGPPGRGRGNREVTRLALAAAAVLAGRRAGRPESE